MLYPLVAYINIIVSWNIACNLFQVLILQNLLGYLASNQTRRRLYCEVCHDFFFSFHVAFAIIFCFFVYSFACLFVCSFAFVVCLSICVLFIDLSIYLLICNAVDNIVNLDGT